MGFGVLVPVLGVPHCSFVFGPGVSLLQEETFTPSTVLCEAEISPRGTRVWLFPRSAL